MTKKQLIEKVKPCTVDFEGMHIDGRITVVLEAPDGYRFGPIWHTEVTEGEVDEPAASVYRTVFERFRKAELEKCPDDCECYEEPEFTEVPNA